LLWIFDKFGWLENFKHGFVIPPIWGANNTFLKDVRDI